MKESLEKKYTTKTISEEELSKYKKQIIIKKLILEVVYLTMIIVSFVRINKNAVFYNILGDGNFFSFYGIALALFFVTMYAMFLFNTSLLGYIVIKKINKQDYLELLHMANVKLDIWTFICKCLSILLFLLIYITTPCTVVGESMVGTLNDGDKLLCIDVFYEPKKDDIVVFDASDYTGANSFYIKRTMGIEGTIVSYIDGRTYIDGNLCEDISASQFNVIKTSINKYVSITDRSKYIDSDNSFIIPEGCLLVLGDNRQESLDSRAFGLIKKEDILGKVFFRMFPINGIRFF